MCHICSIHAGVAVATAFCAIESPAVTSASEWTFGVTDTGISDFGFFIILVQDSIFSSHLCQSLLLAAHAQIIYSISW